jgi:hypothetical protein
VFSDLKHVEYIADSVSEPPPPPLLWTDMHPGTGALPIVYIAEPWEHDTQGCLETNQQTNPFYPFAMHNEYKYISCGIERNSMRTEYDNVPNEENTAQLFPSFQNRDCVQTIVASMPDDQALGQWELNTLEDRRGNDNGQHPIKYWS